MDVDGKGVKIVIWDPPAQAHPWASASYYKGANSVVLTYDSTSEESFEALEKFRGEIAEKAPSAYVTLCANKRDLDQVVTAERGRALAEEHGFSFFETSAKTGEGIQEMFQAIAAEAFKPPKAAP